MAAPIQGRPVRLCWFEVPWVCGRVAGVRFVRAPDAQSAGRDLEMHPADFGLQHESVIVGRAIQRSSPVVEELP